MADHRDDQEIESMVVVKGAEEIKAPLAKRRRLVRVVDKKVESSSSTPPPTSSAKKFFADVIAAEKRGPIELPDPKAPKTKVPMTTRLFFLPLMALSSN